METRYKQRSRGTSCSYRARSEMDFLRPCSPTDHRGTGCSPECLHPLAPCRASLHTDGDVENRKRFRRPHGRRLSRRLSDPTQVQAAARSVSNCWLAMHSYLEFRLRPESKSPPELWDKCHSQCLDRSG